MGNEREKVSYQIPLLFFRAAILLLLCLSVDLRLVAGLLSEETVCRPLMLEDMSLMHTVIDRHAIGKLLEKRT